MFVLMSSKERKCVMEQEPELFLHPNLEWLIFELETRTDYLEYRLQRLEVVGELLLLDVKRVLGTDD